jgi:hypothetical protein
MDPEPPPAVTTAPVVVFLTVQAVAPVQVQARVEDLPLEIRDGVAVKVQGPGGPAVQAVPIVSQEFEPEPPTMTQELFWHSRWDTPLPLQAGSMAQEGPTPTRFTQACCTASQTLPCGLPPLPQSELAEQRLGPGPVIMTHAAATHSAWLDCGWTTTAAPARSEYPARSTITEGV